MSSFTGKKTGFIFIASGYCNGVSRLGLENAHLTRLDFISRMIYFCIVFTMFTST